MSWLSTRNRQAELDKKLERLKTAGLTTYPEDPYIDVYLMYLEEGVPGGWLQFFTHVNDRNQAQTAMETAEQLSISPSLAYKWWESAYHPHLSLGEYNHLYRLGEHRESPQALRPLVYLYREIEPALRELVAYMDTTAVRDAMFAGYRNVPGERELEVAFDAFDAEPLRRAAAESLTFYDASNLAARARFIEWWMLTPEPSPPFIRNIVSILGTSRESHAPVRTQFARNWNVFGGIKALDYLEQQLMRTPAE